MWMLVQGHTRPPAIVYDPGPGPKFCFLSNGDVLESWSLTDSFRTYLRDPTTWCAYTVVQTAVLLLLSRAVQLLFPHGAQPT